MIWSQSHSPCAAKIRSQSYFSTERMITSQIRLCVEPSKVQQNKSSKRKEQMGVKMVDKGVVVPPKKIKKCICPKDDMDDVVSSKKKRRKVCVLWNEKSYILSDLEVHSQLL